MKCPHCDLEISIRLAKGSDTPPTSSSAPMAATSNVSELLKLIHDDQLTPWEETFIKETRERVEKWGDRIRMSDKQVEILRKIAAK